MAPRLGPPPVVLFVGYRDSRPLRPGRSVGRAAPSGRPPCFVRTPIRLPSPYSCLLAPPSSLCDVTRRRPVCTIVTHGPTCAISAWPTTAPENECVHQVRRSATSGQSHFHVSVTDNGRWKATAEYLRAQGWAPYIRPPRDSASAFTYSSVTTENVPATTTPAGPAVPTLPDARAIPNVMTTG